MRFRPCIDLHDGKVKQIVGSTLGEEPSSLRTNFSSPHPPSFYVDLYRRDNLYGGHVIMLGPGNEAAAMEALAAWPGGMQLGGGITAANAAHWLERGASHVIVTSWIFHDGQVDLDRLEELFLLLRGHPQFKEHNDRLAPTHLPAHLDGSASSRRLDRRLAFAR